MNMISEQVKELRGYANVSLYAREIKARELLRQAADTIETLSAKLQAANMDNGSKWIPCEDRLQRNNVTIKQLIDKLAEYEDLVEQGKLLKPKCLPGDYVWEVNKERNIISEYEVSSIRYGINKTFHYMWTLRDGIYGNLDGFRDDDFGKTVFLTRPEAERELVNKVGCHS